MGIGASIFLIAAGAVMTFAIEVQNSEGINVNTIGIILMVVGAIGLVMTAIVFAPNRREPAGGTTVVETRKDVY